MNSMTISAGLTVVMLMGLLAYIILDIAALPDVWISYSTGDCVKVLNYVAADKYSCESLPNKYNHVWVK